MSEFAGISFGAIVHSYHDLTGAKARGHQRVCGIPDGRDPGGVNVLVKVLEHLHVTVGLIRGGFGLSPRGPVLMDAEDTAKKEGPRGKEKGHAHAGQKKDPPEKGKKKENRDKKMTGKTRKKISKLFPLP